VTAFAHIITRLQLQQNLIFPVVVLGQLENTVTQSANSFKLSVLWVGQVF